MPPIANYAQLATSFYSAEAKRDETTKVADEDGSPVLTLLSYALSGIGTSMHL